VATTTSKSRNGNAGTSTKRSTSRPTAAKRTSSSAQKRSSSNSTAKRRSTTQSRSRAQAAGDGNRAADLAKGAVSALAGSAAVGLAARAAIKRAQRPKLLGVPLPRALKPSKLDLKKVVKQVGDVADRVESASEGVRKASAQTKRVTKKLS
jgi:hypothetical protein